jgi:MFS family permease
VNITVTGMTKRIITPVVLLVSFVSLFTDIASEMLYPVMPVFLQSIGFSVLLIGLLEGLAELVAGLSKGYFGQLSDLLGKRVPFIRWGYGMSALAKPLMALFSFPLWIFLARTLDRLGKGVRNSARDALLSDESGSKNKGRVFGFHRAMDTTGAAVGPVLALIWLWIHPGSYKTLFLIAFLPGLVAVILTFVLKDTHPKHKINRESSAGFFSYFGYWKQASIQYKILIPGLLAFTLFNSSDAFLLLAIKNKGFTDQGMIAFYIFYNLLYAILSYPLGKLGDWIGLKKVIVSGLLVFAFVYAGFSVAFEIWHFMVLMAMYALYAASTEGVVKAWISNHSDKSQTATAIGFFNSFSSILAFFASALGGFIWFEFGPKFMFLFSFTGVSLVVVYLFALKVLSCFYDSKKTN